MRCAALAISVLWVWPALGQNADRSRELVEELASESFVTRELAEDELQSDPTLTLEDLERELGRDDLTDEQRLRLLKAASVRFAIEPRAAMGIDLSTEPSELGVRIDGTIAGFDSAEKLRANDIIAVIGDIEIRSQMDLQAAIVSRSPDEVVPVEVVRGAERLTFDIRLGPWSALSARGSVAQPSIETAWRYRSRGYAGKGEPEVIDFDADPMAWNAAAVRPWNTQGGGRGAGGEALRPLVVVGGEARPRPGSLAGVRLDRPLAPSARGRASDFPPMLRQELIKAELDLAHTEERIRRLRVQLAQSQEVGARASQIQQIESQIAEFGAALEELQRRADRIRQELSDLGIQNP